MDAGEIPTLEELLGEVGEEHAAEESFSLEATPPPPSSAPAPQLPPQAPRPASAAPARSALADAFSAFLSAEQGEPADAVQIGPPPPQIDTAALAADVAERVLATLRAEAGDMKELVSRVTSEVAERLVREEISRIRGTQGR
jgi:hypothetical protein